MKPQQGRRRRKRPREMVLSSALFHPCCCCWPSADSNLCPSSNRGSQKPTKHKICCPETIKHVLPQQPPFIHSACVSCPLPYIGPLIAWGLLAWPCTWSVCWLGPLGSKCQVRVGSTSSLLWIMPVKGERERVILKPGLCTLVMVQRTGCDQHVDTLLISWWWGNWESASSTFWFQPVWGLHACRQHTVKFSHMVGISVSAKQLKGHGSEYYL